MLDAERLSDEEFYVLSVLTLKRQMTTADLDAGINGVLGEKSRKALNALIQRGYVCSDTDTMGDLAHELTNSGSTCALRLISAAKAAESNILAHLGYEDSTILKSLLKRLLEVIDPGAAALWEDDHE
jgi:3-hydroxy-9,10-secoandrosta-1,3,5(10)-triene-9,17-dione monooxygenase reductase component